MESNINGGGDTQPNDSSPHPQISKSIIEQRSNEDTGKCDHFSIRAYVADIRKKDWKICWPFCSSVEFYEDKYCEGNVDITSYEYLPLIDLVRKENNSSVMSNPKIRHNVFASGKKKSNVAETVHEGISEPTCTRRKDIQFLGEQNVSRDAETTNLDGGGDLNCGILDFEFGDRKLKCKRTSSHETCLKGDSVHTVAEIAKTWEKGKELESMESGSLDSQASCYRNLSSLKSSRNYQNKDTEGVQKKLKSKRPQKIRLLSDILGTEISGGSCDLSSSNGTVNSDNMDTRVTDTEAADDSDDLTLDTLFRTPKIVQPNTGKITEFRNKKKRLQVEDLRPGQRRWSNGESEVWSCKISTKENNSVWSVIGSSESVKTSSKMSKENLCQESLLVSTDLESKETQGNHQFRLPNDGPTRINLLKPNVGGSQNWDWKSNSRVKEGRDKGSSMLPHEFVPMKDWVGGKDVNVGPYFPVSNGGSDIPHHLKNKHGTLKRKKGSSFPCNYENNIVARENSEVTEIPSSEFDDIPMEIVKLLAENRRERRLLEAETANRETVCLLRSANGVENPRKLQPTRAYDDVKSKDLRKNTSQVQRKPFRAGGDTLDGPTSLGMAIAPQGRDPHSVCFPYAVNNSTTIKDSQMSAKPSLKQHKPLEVKIYSKKTAEKPCACVQKKIKMSPKLDASPTTNGNVSMPEMQLLRLMETGTSSRTPHKITDAHKRPFRVEQDKHHTFGEPMVRICGTRGQVSEDNVKSCKKANLKSSLETHQAMNGTVNEHISGKNSLGRGYESFSFNKGQSSASDYIVLPVEPNMINGRVKHSEVKKKKKKGAIAWPVKGSEICAVNRNPADFSIPGTGNKFMRRGKSENSRKGKAKSTSGKMAGSMNGLIPTGVA